MRVTLEHRGYQIEAERDKCLGGWTVISWAIFWKADMLECDSGVTEENATALQYAIGMKKRVDAELAEPFSEQWGGLLADMLPSAPASPNPTGAE